MRILNVDMRPGPIGLKKQPWEPLRPRR